MGRETHTHAHMNTHTHTHTHAHAHVLIKRTAVEIGLCWFASGTGVKRDLDEAVRYWTLAAKSEMNTHIHTHTLCLFLVRVAFPVFLCMAVT